jgi:hypothetical protein
MQKTEILQHLKDAKEAHLKWVHRAKLLVSGIDVKENSIPVEYTDCHFGQWYYGDGQEIMNMPGMDIGGVIEIKHKELHQTYRSIFEIYFKKEKKTFLSKIFRQRKKVSVDEQGSAQQYYEKLQIISKEMLQVIEKIERRVGALPESSFTN